MALGVISYGNSLTSASKQQKEGRNCEKPKRQVFFIAV